MDNFRPVSLALALLAFLGLGSCATPISNSQCQLEEPQLIASEGASGASGSLSLAAWTFSDDNRWWRPEAPDSFRRWQQTMRDSAETNPVRLLERSATHNNLLVMSKHVQWIGPVNCIEALLMQQQFLRVPLERGSTEFAAMFLRSPDGQRLRIYNFTRNLDGIGNIRPLMEAALPDLREGWQMQAILHNHNFHPGDVELNGILAPSGPDAALAQSLAAEHGLEAIWITNGIDTVRIPADAFAGFSTE